MKSEFAMRLRGRTLRCVGNVLMQKRRRAVLVTEEEFRQRQKELRQELSTWLEAHIADFLAQIDGPPLKLPVIEDFRLLICVGDGADSENVDYYPVVDSGSAYHRQLGLLEQASWYIRHRPQDDG
jgi:hypothetical protein